MIRLSAPNFWYERISVPAICLKPFAWVWRMASRLRAALATPYKAKAKVICIGNVSAGGAGKTPLAINLMGALQNTRACFLTRGFGGKAAGPILIDTDTANFIDYGDEALLLARHGPTIVARNRVEGLKLADSLGYEIVIVDDGFQNPHFVKTLSILVFDGAIGIGNGLCLPAGPCREPLFAALPRAAAAIIVGADTTHLKAQLHAIPTFAAHFKASYSASDTPYIAFAGIGRPAKFFETLKASNYKLVANVPFPDHHVFTGADISNLIALATQNNARLITTEKDFVRLPEGARIAVDVLPVNLKVDGMPELLTLINTRLQP